MRISAEDGAKCIIAYEPIRAIEPKSGYYTAGTGVCVMLYEISEIYTASRLQRL